MCGRYSLRARLNQILEEFAVESAGFEWEPRDNIKPTNLVPIVRVNADHRELALAKWGLVAPWGKPGEKGIQPINARAEGIAEKPMFRTPLKQRRCIVPADSYFEFEDVGKKVRKRPHRYTIEARPLFGIAGLWNTTKDASGLEVLSFTIITTAANDFCAELHDRMPVILPLESYGDWLAKGGTELLESYPSEEMQEAATEPLD